MKVVRKQLSPGEFSPTNQRYNSETDTVEFSPDGGTTWVPMPSLDPRHSTAFLYPPLGEDVRCDAAANMVKWIKDFLDQTADLLCAGAEAFAVANAAIPLYELISGGSLTLLALITEIAGTLTGIGCTALTAAFDESTYAALLCCFYCNIENDGQVTADDLTAVEDQVTSDLVTTAALVVNAILFLQGEVGLSNAGTIGAQTGDCDACDCETTLCVGFNDGDIYDFFTNPVGSLAPVGSLDESFGNPEPSGHSGQNVSYGSFQMWVSVRIDLGEPRHLTAAEYQFYFTSNVGDAIYRAFFFLDEDEVEIAHWDIATGQTQNAWLGYEYGGDALDDVRYVVAVLGQSSGTAITGDIWVDNICASWTG